MQEVTYDKISWWGWVCPSCGDLNETGVDPGTVEKITCYECREVFKPVKKGVSSKEKLEKIKGWAEKRCWDKIALYSLAHQITIHWDELIACGEAKMINAPKTKEEARRYGYSKWAGNPKGIPYQEDQCAYEAWEVRWGSHQCPRKDGHGPSELYCKQHAKIVEA